MDFTALDTDPFLSIDNDYFYHTQNPYRPEVSAALGYSHSFWPLMRHVAAVME